MSVEEDLRREIDALKRRLDGPTQQERDAAQEQAAEWQRQRDVARRAMEDRAFAVQPWQVEMAQAVPTGLVRDLVADAMPSLRGPVKPTDQVVVVPATEARRSVEIGPPPLPEVRWVDRIAEGFDQRERLEALAKQKALLDALKPKAE
jgi:hypothetical protein